MSLQHIPIGFSGTNIQESVVEALWVLLVNVILVYNLLKTATIAKIEVKLDYRSCILFLPFVLSYLIHPAKQAQVKSATNVIIVQPNIDPYSEKFDVASTEGQIQKLIIYRRKK